MKHYLLTLLMGFCCLGLGLAQRTVVGKISGDDGEALIGASVAVKGVAIGAIADLEGKYSVRVPNGYNTLIVSYTGYATQEITLSVSNVVDVTLVSGTLLEEAVVTALGIQTEKSKIGTAATTVQGDALQRSAEVSVINSLAGKSAGVNIVASSGDPGASSRIQIRGATSITGDLQPLIVIDGVPYFNDSYYGEGFGGNDIATSGSLGTNGGVTQQSRMNDLNPDDIASIEVIRGASAAAIWGSRAANGVLVVTTKKGKSNKQKDFSVSLNSSVAFDEVNKKIPLTKNYGQGNGMKYQFEPGGGRSWGDYIPDRAGGTDQYITDPNAAGYAGYFEAADGDKYYAIANGTNANPHGGKRSSETFDLYDYLFHTGLTSNNAVSINSANEKGGAYFSLSHVNQNGIVVTNSNYKKTTATLNASRNLGDQFTVEGGATYSLVNSDRVQMGSNLNGLFLGGLRTPVDFEARDYTGTYVDPNGIPFTGRQRAYRNPLGANTTSIYDNPLWMLNNVNSTTQVNRLVGRLEMRYYPLQWLSFTARGGADTYTDERDDFFPVLSSGFNNTGRYTKETIVRSQFNLDAFARAQLKPSANINLNLLAGTNFNRRTLNDHGTTAQNFVNPLAPPQLTNGLALTPFNLIEERRTHGLYATAGLELWQQVFVNLTGRNDFVSTLPEGKNSFFYPAADASWQFSKMFKNPTFISAGKLRAGFGKVGREPDPYLLRNTYFVGNSSNFGFGESWGPGINPTAYGGAFAISQTAGNAALRPEIKTEFEFGADLGFLKDRIGLNVTYYQNKVKDAILNVRTPESSGFISQISNAASLENKGVEIEANFRPIRKKNLDWNIYGNWTRNRNVVTDMAGANSILISGFNGGSSRAVVGEQLGVLWGGRWERDAAGKLDLDENGFPQASDVTGIIGDPNPDFRAGAGTELRWKSLTLNVLFDASIGGQIWNGTKGALSFFGRAGFTDVTTVLTEEQARALKIWTGNTVAEAYAFAKQQDGSYRVRGEIKNYGAGDVFVEENWYRIGPGGSGFTGPEEEAVEDASWTRLREVTLSYNFDPKKYGVKGLTGATLSLTGRNLLLWTKYSGNDPDTSLNGPGNNGFGLDYFQNPSTRTYRIALNLTF